MNPLRSILFMVATMVAYATSLPAQSGQFNWTQPRQYNYAIGGDSGREAVASTVFNNKVYMVYTTRTPYTGGNYYMNIATSTDGITFTSPSQINLPTGPAAALSNPSLTVFNGLLFLAYNSAGGVAHVISSSNGSTWSSSTQLPVPSVDYSPSIASGGTSLLIGLHNSADFTTELCTSTSGSGYTCFEPGTVQMNFNPALTYGPDGKYYIAFEYRGDSHVLYYYTYNNGISGLNTSASSDSTSAAPALITLSQYLYMGFRANDGGHGFYTKGTFPASVGSSWSASSYSGYGIGGAPSLFTGLSAFPNKIFCLYVANDSSHTMYAMAGTPR